MSTISGLNCCPGRLEAVPRPGSTRRPVRSGDERPAEDAWTPGELRARPDSRPQRLPCVLAGARVLVVDDDETTLELFAAALGACGAEVTTASRARDAVQVLATRTVDVVVSDIAMPGEDGYWLVRQIQRLADERGRVPVVAVTAYGREHSRARALEAGFADHLQKPVDPDVLCRTVARAAGR